MCPRESVSKSMSDLDSFDANGFVIVDGAVEPAICDQLCSELELSAVVSAGSRALLANSSCAQIARMLGQHPRIRPLLPPGAVAVQCTLFNKTADRNWLVPLHQDVAIPVRTR